MRRESRKHFLHRIGNRLGNKLNKKSNLNKVRHSIKFHLKDALKIAVGIGKVQSQERTKNAHNQITLKYALRSDMLTEHPLLIPTDQSHGDGQR